MAKFKEYCKRGHLMAETRRISQGKTRCCVCATERGRRARLADPGRFREAVNKYRRSDKGKQKARKYERTEQYRARDRERARRKAEKVRGGPARLMRRTNIFYIGNKLYNFEWHLLRKYNMTLDDYTKMFTEQNGRCAICRRKPEYRNHGGNRQSRRLVVDHCHATNVVRGLLCFNCNTAIGLIGDSANTLDKMQRYLRNHAQLQLNQPAEQCELEKFRAGA